MKEIPEELTNEFLMKFNPHQFKNVKVCSAYKTRLRKLLGKTNRGSKITIKEFYAYNNIDEEFEKSF